jgi:hypothetical protein
MYFPTRPQAHASSCPGSAAVAGALGERCALAIDQCGVAIPVEDADVAELPADQEVEAMGPGS